MPLTLDIGQATHPGRVRESNEDRLCVLMPPQLVEDFDALLAVADGMGGHRAGEVASQYVADTLGDLFASLKYRSWVEFSPEREDYAILVLKEIIERMNDELYQMAARREDWRGMGTTITAALIVNDKLYIGHVGDSRAYVLSNGTLRQLTKDHSWVMEQVEQGLMSSEQAASDPRKNQITRALGVSSLVKVDRLIEDLHSGDLLLLCSDGLSNMVSEAEIVQALRTHPDPQKACEILVQWANQHGGGDNITVVVARVSAAGQTPVDVAPTSAFDKHDTQPLGPAGQFKGRTKKSAEPIRMAQSVPPPTVPAPVIPPSGVPDSPPIEIQATTFDQSAAAEAGSPIEEPAPADLPAQEIPAEPPTPAAQFDSTKAAVSSVEILLRSRSSPMPAWFSPVLTGALCIGFAVFAALMNGGIVLFSFTPTPIADQGIIAAVVAASTLLFVMLAFVFSGAISEISSRRQRFNEGDRDDP